MDLELRSWRIELPITKPLSLNARMHWRVKAKHTAALRALAGVAIRDADLPPMKHLRACVEYQPRDARRRDPINLIPTLKACEDALQDQGVVPDDTPEYVESVMPRILPKSGKGSGRVWLIIDEG